MLIFRGVGLLKALFLGEGVGIWGERVTLKFPGRPYTEDKFSNLLRFGSCNFLKDLKGAREKQQETENHMFQ